MKFRKKPVVVEAVQFTGFVNDETDACKNAWPDEWRVEVAGWHRCPTHPASLVVPCVADCCPGDWIVREAGEFLIYSPGAFAATYEAASDDENGEEVHTVEDEP